MKLDINTLRDHLTSYFDDKNNADYYEVNIDSDSLSMPDALSVIRALGYTAEQFDLKAEFVRKLLIGRRVTITLYGEKVADFGVQEATQWHALPELNRNPLALKFLVASVWTMFLKNSVPHLTDSQRQVRDQMNQATQQKAE